MNTHTETAENIHLFYWQSNKKKNTDSDEQENAEY